MSTSTTNSSAKEPAQDMATCLKLLTDTLNGITIQDEVDNYSGKEEFAGVVRYPGFALESLLEVLEYLQREITNEQSLTYRLMGPRYCDYIRDHVLGVAGAWRGYLKRHKTELPAYSCMPSIWYSHQTENQREEHVEKLTQRMKKRGHGVSPLVKMAALQAVSPKIQRDAVNRFQACLAQESLKVVNFVSCAHELLYMLHTLISEDEPERKDENDPDEGWQQLVEDTEQVLKKILEGDMDGAFELYQKFELDAEDIWDLIYLIYEYVSQCADQLERKECSSMPVANGDMAKDKLSPFQRKLCLTFLARAENLDDAARALGLVLLNRMMEAVESMGESVGLGGSVMRASVVQMRSVFETLMFNKILDPLSLGLKTKNNARVQYHLRMMKREEDPEAFKGKTPPKFRKDGQAEEIAKGYKRAREEAQSESSGSSSSSANQPTNSDSLMYSSSSSSDAEPSSPASASKKRKYLEEEELTDEEEADAPMDDALPLRVGGGEGGLSAQ